MSLNLSNKRLKILIHPFCENIFFCFKVAEASVKAVKDDSHNRPLLNALLTLGQLQTKKVKSGISKAYLLFLKPYQPTLPAQETNTLKRCFISD